MKLKRWIAGILSLGMLAAAPLSGFPAAAESAVTGDVDGSSEVDLLDLVMLQKWMLGAGELSAPENADMRFQILCHLPLFFNFDAKIIKSC